MKKKRMRDDALVVFIDALRLVSAVSSRLICVGDICPHKNFALGIVDVGGVIWKMK